MKKCIRAIAAITGCAALSSTLAFSAFADSDDTVQLKINKPYLNAVVEGADGLNLKLVDENGNVAAEWKGGEETDASVADGIYNITEAKSISSLPADAFTPENPGTLYDKTNKRVSANDDGSYSLKLGTTYFNIYQPEAKLEGERMTVSSGEYKLIVDSAYSDYGTTTGVVFDEIDGSSRYYFADNAGKTLTFTAPEAGDSVKTYSFIKVNGGEGKGSGATLTTYTESKSYVKVSLNISEMTKGYFTEDAKTYKGYSDTELYVDLINPDSTDLKCVYYFSSGSVISASIPDKDGNVWAWVCEDDPKVYLSTDFEGKTSSGSYVGGGGVSGLLGKNFIPDKVTEYFSTDFEIPESGLTLYDIPAGEYTLTTDSEEYEIVNGSITVTDSKDLQILSASVKKIDTTSSEDSSSEDDSSETDSSEIDSSEADSSAADSSEVESSATDSSEADTSSTASSAASSAASSSQAGSSSASASGKDSNPATGAAAGGMAAIVFAAGLVAVKKKNR